MNIVKLGGSIVNPDGKYDEKVIQEFIAVVKNSSEKFIFVVGGGKMCRFVQETVQPFLELALPAENIPEAHDWIGIAVTKINATYVLHKFKEQLREIVYPEIILDPKQKITTHCRIFFAGGWKPGCSTDKDMILLAENFQASKVFKISDFEIVKKIKPQQLAALSAAKREQALKKAAEIASMSWNELLQLVEGDWSPGLHTPFDPEAALIGQKLKRKLILYIGRKEEFPKMLLGGEFKGTVVKG